MSMSHRGRLILRAIEHSPEPIDGYAITDYLKRSVPSCRTLNDGHVNYELKRLEKWGLIRLTGHALGRTGHQKKLFCITEAGRKTLLVETDRLLSEGLPAPAFEDSPIARFVDLLAMTEANAPERVQDLLKQRAHLLDDHRREVLLRLDTSSSMPGYGKWGPLLVEWLVRVSEAEEKLLYQWRTEETRREATSVTTSGENPTGENDGADLVGGVESESAIAGCDEAPVVSADDPTDPIGYQFRQVSDDED